MYSNKNTILKDKDNVVANYVLTEKDNFIANIENNKPQQQDKEKEKSICWSNNRYK